MTSLTKCLKGSSLSPEDKAAIKASAREYRSDEGMGTQDAANAAVNDAIESAAAERIDVVSYIQKRGGAAPEAPKDPIGAVEAPVTAASVEPATIVKPVSVEAPAEVPAKPSTGVTAIKKKTKKPATIADLKKKKPKEPVPTKPKEEPGPQYSKPHGSAVSVTSSEDGSTAEDVQAWVDPITLKWADNTTPEIEVVQSFNVLPKEIQNAAGSEDINGVYHQGKIYLVADSIKDKRDALRVLAHESIGHHSMGQIVDNWSKLSKDIIGISTGSKEERKISEQVRLRYGNLEPQLFAKEFLAIAAERKYLPGTLKDILTKVRVAIRKILIKMGLGRIWASTDVNVLIARASKNLMDENIDPKILKAIGGDPLFSRTPPKRQTGNPDLDSLIEKANPEPASKWKKYIPDFGSAENRQKWFAKFHSLELLDKEAGVTDEHLSSFVAARMSTSPETQLWVSLVKNPLKWVNGEVGLNQNVPGLLEILNGVSEKMDLFSAYLVAKRSARLAKEGREQFITPDEIAAGLQIGIDHPEVESAAEKWYEFNSALLDFAEEAGYIDPDARAMWEETDYVPFYRLLDDEKIGKPAKGKGLQTSKIQRLRGSERGINNVLENMILNAEHLISSSMKERALGLARDRMLEVGMARKVGLKSMPAMIPLDQINGLLNQNTGPFAEIRVWLESEGIDASAVPSSALQQIQQMWALTVPKGKDIVQIRNKGKPEWYQVDDPLLMRSLTAVNDQAFGSWMKFFSLPKRFLTSMVTLDPTFQLRNWLRDSGSAFVLARNNVTPFFSGISGFYDAHKKDDLFWNVMAQGGGFHSGFVTAGDPSATRAIVSKELRKAELLGKVTSYPRKGFDAWMQFSSNVENANRLAIAKSVLKDGKSNLMAAFEAKDFMDFSQRGDYAVLNFLAQTVPFLNARLQGTYRLYKGAGIAKQDRENLLIRNNPAGFFMHGMLITAATIALWAFNRDDDRYNELNEWDKDLHWHFFFGDTHLKMPKPFEIGMIFGSIPERALDSAYNRGDEATKIFLQRFGWMAFNVFNLNPVPQTVKPIVEQFANKDMFLGRPIEGMSEAGALPADRHNIWTHETSKQIGKILNVSPVRIDHLVRAYAGSIGNYAMSSSDMLLRSMIDLPAYPSPRPDDYPVIKAVYSATPPKSTRFGKEFYDLYNKTEQALRSFNKAKGAKDKERMLNIIEDHRPELATRKILNHYRNNIKNINVLIRKVHNNKTMSGEQKREKLDDLLTRKNKIQRIAVEQVKQRQEKIKATQQLRHVAKSRSEAAAAR